jgi:hypothetical protein
VRALAALAVAAALVAAVAVRGGGTAFAACAAAVQLRGITYVGSEFKRLPARGGPVAGGVQPGCNDTGPATPPEPDRPVALRTLKGVPTRIAVTGSAGSRTAYLAPGFLLELRSHPLHAYARLGAPSSLFGCRAPTVLRGHTRSQPGAGGLFVLFAGTLRVEVRVRSSTRVLTRRVAGTPYLGARQRLEVRGCRSTSGAVIAADSVRRLPPVR